MIKIGMCDDDLIGIELTSKLVEAEIIEQNFDAEIVLVTNNQKEIFDAIYSNQIDILFLDVDFKGNGKNGIEFAQDLRNISKDFYLVFLSAHQKYVHPSLSVKVFDYLIKPINRETLEDIITRLKSDFNYSHKTFLHLNKRTAVRINEILYVEKAQNKSRIVSINSIDETSKTLDVLLQELPHNFRKSHRSYIVNDQKIIKIDKKENYAYFSKDFKCPINSHFEI